VRCDIKEQSMRFSALATLALTAATLAGLAAPAQTTTPWDYEGNRGALVWGKLDPSYSACSKGHEQSPIDIRGARLNKSLLPLEFHYIAGSVTLENIGHTIRAYPAKGSYMVANGERYELVSFEFHHPSEGSVRGKLTDMDVDLLHQSADGKIAILNLQLVEDRGAANAVMATLWPHLPEKPGATAKVTEFVNPAGFVPADPGYWTYMGSLTAPPCTEGVRWFVFEQPLSISRDQLRRFAALYKVNSRPMQEIGKRKIEADE
jgi:carbonic anhydrase